LLDLDGAIAAVNKVWRDFSAGNGGPRDFVLFGRASHLADLGR
jgi:hypothetical protein